MDFTYFSMATTCLYIELGGPLTPTMTMLAPGTEVYVILFFKFHVKL